MKYIKQFGIQRSGTNIVKALLEENYDVRVLNLILGNKHLPFDIEEAKQWAPEPGIAPMLDITFSELQKIREQFVMGEIGCTAIIKEPYSWLRSIYRYRCYKASKPLPFDHKFIADNIRLWMELNSRWLRELPLQFPKGIIVSYRDVLLEPDEFLRQHQSAFGLSHRTGKLVSHIPFATRAAADKDRGSAMLAKKAFEKSYYLERKYLEEYESIDEKLLRELLAEATPSLSPFIQEDKDVRLVWP